MRTTSEADRRGSTLTLCQRDFEMHLHSRFLTLGITNLWDQIIFWCLHVLQYVCREGSGRRCSPVPCRVVECMALLPRVRRENKRVSYYLSLAFSTCQRLSVYSFSIKKNYSTTQHKFCENSGQSFHCFFKKVIGIECHGCFES